jgi:MoaA/NifB/PqqE/SkfB family radical SAM enzyme
MEITGGFNLIKGILLSRIKKTPYKLNFAITSACNSQCQTCNVWKIFRQNPKIAKNDLKLWEIEKIFQKLSSSISWISFSGGEPFLRDDLFQIIQSAIKNLPRLAFISMPTNGLAKKRIIEVVQRIFSISHPAFYLYFSLDGPREIHDRVRGIKGSFEKTWETYQTIKKLARKNDDDFHVGIETTISVINASCLMNFLKKLKREGHEITVTIAHNAYLYHNEKDKKLTPEFDEKIIELLKFLEKNQKFYPPQNLLEKIYVKKAISFLKNRGKMVLPCTSMKGTIAIQANGDVTPCFMWGKILGNLRDYNYDIKEILGLQTSRETRKMIMQEKCPICWTPCESIQTIIDNFPSSLWR